MPTDTPQLDLTLDRVDDETLSEALARRGGDDPNTLRDHLPRRLREADGDAIDWDALCRQIGTHRGTYELPRTPDDEPGPWLDRLAVMKDAAMHVRDGGSIDVDAVVQDTDAAGT